MIKKTRFFSLVFLVFLVGNLEALDSFEMAVFCDGMIFQKASGVVGGVWGVSSLPFQNGWWSSLKVGGAVEGGWVGGGPSSVFLFSVGMPLMYSLFSRFPFEVKVGLAPLATWLWGTSLETEITEMVFLGETLAQSSSTEVFLSSSFSLGVKSGVMGYWYFRPSWALVVTVGYHYRDMIMWGPYLSLGVGGKFSFSSPKRANETSQRDMVVAEQSGVDQRLEERFTNLSQTFFDSSKKTLILTNIGYAVNEYAVPVECVPILEEIYSFLVQNTNYSLVISGHTDDVGGEEYNLELSQKRAKAIAEFFMNKGIPSTRLKWKGYGKSRPRVKGKDEAARAQNRRVEIEFLEGKNDE
ncbi:MAG: OmpA family protein [Brevinematales bacterium]|nr:OmpA family protein [Brevinematales bacterium]